MDYEKLEISPRPADEGRTNRERTIRQCDSALVAQVGFGFAATLGTIGGFLADVCERFVFVCVA